MPTMTLTAASVERLKTPTTGQLEYYDRRLPSFGVRLSYHGTRSWFVMTRLDGKLIRVTLGRHPSLSLAEAREEARRVVNLAAAGKDPRQIRSEAKQKRREERRNSFDVCADEFLQKYAERHLRPSTQREYRRILKGKDTRSWRDRPVSEISKRDVLDVIEDIDGRGSPGASKRALAYLRKFFNWCAERDIITMPPTDRIRSPHPEVKRDRVLTEQELYYLLQALEAEQSIFRTSNSCFAFDRSAPWRGRWHVVVRVARSFQRKCAMGNSWASNQEQAQPPRSASIRSPEVAFEATAR